MKEIVRRYSIKQARLIRNACSPLRHLDLPVFTYFKILTDGSFATLSNYPEQLEFYYHHKLYLNNPYLTHPDLIQPGCVLTATTQDAGYLDTVTQSKKNYKLHNTFLMVEKSGQAMEGYFFGTFDSDPALAARYYQHLELLKKFTTHFKLQTERLIGSMIAEGYNMKKGKGSAFLERDARLPLSSSDPCLLQFQKEVSLLSKQQQRCLDLYRQGHSAQATAALLGLSQRTVEHYFETIKEKLGCTSKSELLLIKY